MKKITIKLLTAFGLVAGCFAQLSSQAQCCVTIPPTDNTATITIGTGPWGLNTGDFTEADNPATFIDQVSAPAPIPAGTYLGWCIDVVNNINDSATVYSTELFSSCDTNINNELPTGYPATCYISQANWHAVNYILNHKGTNYFWNIQNALWYFVGGPSPGVLPTPQYPPTNPSAVTAIINAALENAPSWESECGDVVAVVVAINALPHFQLTMIEVPCNCPPPPVVQGDTATIGFWHNKNGQALILSFNGGPNSTALGNWLGDNFPCLFGSLTGKANSVVAAQFLADFSVSGQKTYAQVLAGALAAYATSSTLAGGNMAGKYGFNVSTTGTGGKSYNVGSDGSAIGLSNNTSYTVAQILEAANANCPFDSTVFNALNDIFSGINQTGDIQ